MLRAVGFVGRQLRATVAWQVVTLVAAALVIGLPLGSLVGRAVWLAFADQLGVAADATFLPITTFVVVAAGALVLALIAAVVPGTMVARGPCARARCTANDRAPPPARWRGWWGSVRTSAE